PDVLREAIMDPIGASTTWEWQPYRHSWTTIDGVRMASVPGGSHWGGGLWMSTQDHARFGLPLRRGGRWGGRQLVPAAWVDAARPFHGVRLTLEAMMRTRALIVAVLLAAAALTPSAWTPTDGAPLTPLVIGWEQFFKLTWTVEERRGKPVVIGKIYNNWGFAA